MPNRIIKESIWTSPNLNKVSAQAEVLFFRLICLADDFGRFDARPEVIKGRCYPLRNRVTPSDIESWLSELVINDLLEMYAYEGIPYGAFKTWEKHQRVRNKRSKIPAPDGQEDINPYYKARYIPADSRRRIFKRDNYKCLKCQSEGSEDNPLSIDHVIPVSEGGTSDDSNLQTSCFLCNLQKYTRTIDYRKFAATCGDLRQAAAISGLNPNPNPNPDPKPPYIPPGEGETHGHSKQVKELFDLWNSLGVIKHKKLTGDMTRAIAAASRDFSAAEISQAMKNYAHIVNDEQCFFKYRWMLKDFLKRGLEKFLDLEVALNNYRRGGAGGADKKHPAQAGLLKGKRVRDVRGPLR